MVAVLGILHHEYAIVLKDHRPHRGNIFLRRDFLTHVETDLEPYLPSSPFRRLLGYWFMAVQEIGQFRLHRHFSLSHLYIRAKA
jgi:hypothetical protein